MTVKQLTTHFMVMHLSQCSLFTCMLSFTLIRFLTVLFRRFPAIWASQMALVVNSPHQSRRHRRRSFDPQVRKISWRRTRQPTPVLSPEESHGQRSLVGYNPQDRKESNMTEVTQLTYMHTQSDLPFSMERIHFTFYFQI